jgi:muramoyltetrapeptide carboxypeptidase
MSDMRDKNPNDPFGKTAEQIIADALGDTRYPVCFDFPAGHIDDNRALVFGQQVRLTVTTEQVGRPGGSTLQMRI